MVSRKTYFGIGWKDPNDPEPGAPGKPEPDDRSAPTVVDDEKVAEGLRQLRSWYSGDAQAGQPPSPEATRPTPRAHPLSGSQARPTAVGHATGPPPQAQQRPIAPDPMRATMYGHDVHQFDLDARASTPPAVDPQPPAAQSNALVVTDPARQREAFYEQAEAVSNAMERSTSSDSFPLARFGLGEAERLNRPGHRSASYEVPASRSRLPTASHVVFGIGIAALVAAIVIWLQSGSGGESTYVAPAPPSVQIPAQPAPAATPVPATAQPSLATAPIPAAAVERPAAPAANTALSVPARAAARSAPAAAPIPAAPARTARTEGAQSAAAVKTPRRHKEPRVEATPAAQERDSVAPVVTPTGDKPAIEIKDPIDLRDLSEIKEPKEPKEAKETKSRSSTKEAKEPKEAKGRGADSDATLPPSLE